MVLFPLVVYPLVSLVTAQVLAARVARVEAHVARVALDGPTALTAAVRRHGPDHHCIVQATLRRADEHHVDLCFLGDVADLTFAVGRHDRDLHHGQP